MVRWGTRRVSMRRGDSSRICINRRRKTRTVFWLSPQYLAIIAAVLLISAAAAGILGYVVAPEKPSPSSTIGTTTTTGTGPARPALP